MVKLIKAIIKCFREAKHSLRFRYFNRKDQWGHIGQGTVVHSPSMVSGKKNIFLGDNVNIDWDNVIYAVNAKFIMKTNSGAAVGLTVVTGNHQRILGEPIKKSIANRNNDVEKNVVVEEDVWLAANVTLLSGVHVGRGATVGAGSVCIKNVPPYAIVMGNPAKVIGFTFTPEEIIEHEKKLYAPDERFPLDLLEQNYKKYFLDRINDIKSFTKI